MISKNQKKYIRSLHHKKFRDKLGLFIVEGLRSTSTAIDAKGVIEQIIFTQRFKQKHTYFFEKAGTIPQSLASEHELNQLCPSTSPSGILAICKQIKFGLINKRKNLVYLDKISDPGNIGTILRTAAWFGVDQVGLSPGSADLFNPKVVRGAMGAHFNLTWAGELSVDQLDGYSILGADQKGQPIEHLEKPTGKWALIIGSEAHGISKELENKLDAKITIPRIGLGESLNAGVAAGILLNQLVQ